MPSIRRKSECVKVLSLTLMLVTVAACVRIDTPPSLEITIVDSFNNVVSEALVALFDSQEEWALRENPIQVWKITDSFGEVQFLNLQEKNYFIYAEKGNLNNLTTEITTSSKLINNQIRLLIIHIE